MGKAATAEGTDQVVEGDADTAVLEVEPEGAAAAEPTTDAEGQPGGEAEGQPEGQAEGSAAGEGPDADGDEVVISFGEESPASSEDENRAPEWVRELRKSNREKDRKLREQEAEIARLKGTGQPAATVVGEKPTLEGCDFDTGKFEQALDAWHARKREADDQASAKTRSEEQQRAHWQTRIDAVTKAGAALKVKDYEDAATAFEDQFSIVQQGIVIGGPDDPKTSALLRYALGKNPKKAKELASITDPVKFAFAVAKLETQLKVTPRKAAPAPDTPVRSAVPGAAAVDNQLERLRAEAAKTGDLSKVIAYKNAQRNKQRA